MKNYNLTKSFYLLFIIVELQFFSIECVEQLYRAYIPQNGVKWFHELVKDESNIDLWLSTRLLSEEKSFKLNKTYAIQFDYYADFRTKNENIVHAYNSTFESYGIKLDLLVDDLEKKLNVIHSKRQASRNIRTRNIVGKYVSYDEILNWMENLAKYYPRLVKLRRIGKTYENRDMAVLVLTDFSSRKPSKKLMFLESGIHAREWISISTNIYIVDQIIKSFLRFDSDVFKILSDFEIHVLIVFNPDGYEYSRASKNNRFWRKNMHYTKQSCLGVDLNRNFDFKWMESGSSSNPCSEIYAGSSPQSESEVSHVSNYILSRSPKWVTYIGLHSYGSYWLSPFSYSAKHIHENFQDSCAKALTIIKKIQNRFNSTFEFGSASHILYEASGCSEDWANIQAKINYSYIIELKPSNEDINESQTDSALFGFEYPENLIISSASEIFYGLKEYLSTFDIKLYSKSILKDCAKREKQMKQLAESQSFHNQMPE